MLKVGLIGVGGISGAHIPAWKSLEETELVALCDIRPERMEQYSEQRHYAEFDEMIENEQLDILDICLPTYLHAEYSLKALEKGINVICEKPISLNANDIDKLYDTAEKNNVKFMIAQVLRFWPEYEAVKKMYDTNQYGKLLSGNMSRMGSFPAWSWDGWMMDEKRSGLVPFDLHIHDLDFMVYAFGTPQKAAKFRTKRPDQDAISVIYEFDGFFINSQASWYASGAYPFKADFRFQFEKAVVTNEGGSMVIYENDGNKINLSEGGAEESGTINLPKTDAYLNEIKYFTECVLKNENPEKVKPDELKTVLDVLNNM